MTTSNQTKAVETQSGAILVPINQLVKDPDNVRQVRSKEGIKELADNILAEGLLQNLIVREIEDGQYAVAGGERRRTALNLLVKKGKMQPTDTVVCKLVDSNHVSASLSENIHRIAMHPADQFTAWAKMHDGGLSAQEIAKRHGSTTKQVEKFLKLGRLSATLLKALRKDEIDIETACAFTLTDDHKRQNATYKALKKQWQGLNPRSVKKALTEDSIPSTDKLGKLVGRDDYETAGGTIRTDLFDHVFYFEDAELLTNLATNLMEAEAQRLKSQGWAWIEYAFDEDYQASNKLRKIHPQPVELPEAKQKEKEQLIESHIELEDAACNGDEAAQKKCSTIQDKLDAIEELEYLYNPDEQKMAGVFLSLSYDGSFTHRLGYVRLEDDPQAIAAKEKQAEEKASQPKQLSQALRSDLSAIRLEVLQIEMLYNPQTARDLLTFHTIRETLSSSYTPSPFNLTASKASGLGCNSKCGDMGKFKGREEAEKAAAYLPLQCVSIKDPVEGFEAYRSLSEDEKTSLQAYAASLMLKPQLHDDSDCEATLEYAAQLMSVNVAEYWTPNAVFFSRTNKSYMAEVAESLISKDFVERHSHEKKADLAISVGYAFDEEGDFSEENNEAATRMALWVPDCLRTEADS